MHSFEERINEWRNELMMVQNVDEAVADELEDHLRQKLNELSKLDLCDEDKFILAKSRLGHPEILGDEFKKLNSQSIRLKQIGYMIGGYLLIDTLLKLVHVASKVTSGISLSQDNVIASAATIYIVTNTLLFLALFYGLWKIVQADSPLQRTSLVQRFSAIHQFYPRYTLGIVLLGVIALTFINKFGFSIVMIRYFSVGEFGNFMMTNAVYDISTELLIPFSLSVFLLWIIRADREWKNGAL